MNKKAVLILNRWNDSISNYENIINHNEYNVSYITNKKGALAVKKSEELLCVLEDMSLANIKKFSQTFFQDVKFHRIIALSEVDQEAAAYLRSCLFVPGLKENEIQKFRNKIIMKNIAAQAGILVPIYTDVEEPFFSNFLKFAQFPLILKPKDGVSSEGVMKIKDQSELIVALEKIDKTNYECEEFISGKIYHADGLIYKNEIIFFKVSEYINTCFDYTLGKPLGSVIIDDQIFEEKAKKFTDSVLKAFLLNNGAFHLEFIVDDNGSVFFLELGARVGGANLPYLFRELYGINLMHAWIDIQLNNDISSHLQNIRNQDIGGWLLFPEPRELPCKVIKTESLKGKIPGLIDEKLPNEGYIFRGNGEYRDTCGSYLFKGRDTDAVKTSIETAIKLFYINTTLI